MIGDNDISYFVKYRREKVGMTQEQLAQKAGVGLRFIRDLEQGKESLRLDKVNQVLVLFGNKMVPRTARIIDPYETLLKHTNIAVHIHLKNKTELYGIILGAEMENHEIRAWRFISNNNAIEYNEKNKDKDIEKLVQLIKHADIEAVENYETVR